MSSIGPPSVQSKLDKGLELKQKGNGYFQAGEYAKAISQYTKVFAYTTGLSIPNLGGMEGYISASSSSAPSLTSSQSDLISKLNLDTNSNLSACYLKLNQPHKAIQYASKVLQVDASNIKALTRRGTAYVAVRETEKALQDLKQVLEKDPENAAVKAAMLKCKKVEKEEEEKMRSRFANIFNKKNSGSGNASGSSSTASSGIATAETATAAAPGAEAGARAEAGAAKDELCDDAIARMAAADAMETNN